MINQGLFFESFSTLPDPRKDINKKHLMIDMLFITLRDFDYVVFFKETEKDHGRIEGISHYSSDIDDLCEAKEWAAVKTLAMLKTEATYRASINAKMLKAAQKNGIPLKFA